MILRSRPWLRRRASAGDSPSQRAYLVVPRPSEYLFSLLALDRARHAIGVGAEAPSVLCGFRLPQLSAGRGLIDRGVCNGSRPSGILGSS